MSSPHVSLFVPKSDGSTALDIAALLAEGEREYAFHGELLPIFLIMSCPDDISMNTKDHNAWITMYSKLKMEITVSRSKNIEPIDGHKRLRENALYFNNDIINSERSYGGSSKASFAVPYLMMNNKVRDSIDNDDGAAVDVTAMNVEVMSNGDIVYVLEAPLIRMRHECTHVQLTVTVSSLAPVRSSLDENSYTCSRDQSLSQFLNPVQVAREIDAMSRMFRCQVDAIVDLLPPPSLCLQESMVGGIKYVSAQICNVLSFQSVSIRDVQLYLRSTKGGLSSTITQPINAYDDNVNDMKTGKSLDGNISSDMLPLLNSIPSTECGTIGGLSALEVNKSVVVAPVHQEMLPMSLEPLEEFSYIFSILPTAAGRSELIENSLKRHEYETVLSFTWSTEPMIFTDQFISCQYLFSHTMLDAETTVTATLPSRKLFVGETFFVRFAVANCNSETIELSLHIDQPSFLLNDSSVPITCVSRQYSNSAHRNSIAGVLTAPDIKVLLSASPFSLHTRRPANNDTSSINRDATSASPTPIAMTEILNETSNGSIRNSDTISLVCLEKVIHLGKVDARTSKSTNVAFHSYRAGSYNLGKVRVFDHTKGSFLPVRWISCVVQVER